MPKQIKVLVYCPVFTSDDFEPETIDKIINKIIDKTGGVTVLGAVGGWLNSEKKIENDQILLIETITENTNEVKTFFKQIALEIKEKLKQKSVLIEYQPTKAIFY